MSSSPVIDRTRLNRLRFYVLGDFGTGDAHQAKVAAALAHVALSEPPDFLISTGDWVYEADLGGGKISAADILQSRFEPYYAPLAVEFFQCLGNHDLREVFRCVPQTGVALENYSKVWRMPGASYRLPGLPPWIAIHVVNTNVFGDGDLQAEPDQYSAEQMGDEIDAARKTFAACGGLRILIGHHPVFTPGKRTLHHAGDGELLYMRPMRRLIEKAGVHFYACGHEHHQSHTTAATCEYIVQGCGGAGRRPNPKHARRDPEWRDAHKVFRYLEVKNGFAVFEADSAMRIRVRFFGMEPNDSAKMVRVIYERQWSGLSAIGDNTLCRLNTP